MRWLRIAGPIVEPTRPGEAHLYELARGPTAATTPAVALDVRVFARGRVEVLLWFAGEPVKFLKPGLA